jgi:L-ascorbate metabolism protein UlaG (beta-lactamase superfamily)
MIRALMHRTTILCVICVLALTAACGGSKTEPKKAARADAPAGPAKAEPKAEPEEPKAEPAPARDPRAYALEGDPKVVITPLQHASFYLQAEGQTIHVDPVTSALATAGEVPQADLILVTHGHGDHLDVEAIAKVRKPGAPVVAPEASAAKIADATVLANGDKKTVAGVDIEAVAMYNIERKNDAGKLFHPKGVGNGYVVGVGGRRIYVAGDTECIPEMRSLQKIDAAFVCMNLPYTMTAEEAAECVAAFKPKVAFPYHHRGQDLDVFKKGLGSDIKVEVLDWYPAAADKPAPG